MAVGLEDIKVLQGAEKLGDEVWRVVNTWSEFTRDTVGKQLARATDSIGANIAESFGRYNFGEKTQFLYYARGSLFETKYWFNRALKRGLIAANHHQQYCDQLVVVGRQINTFVNSLKTQRHETKTETHLVIREPGEVYESTTCLELGGAFITEIDFVFLSSTLPEDDQSPIPNLQSPS